MAGRFADSRECVIYALIDPRISVVRYVGRTCLLPVEKYVNGAHIRPAVAGTQDTYKARWLRSLLSNGMTPEIRVIERGLWNLSQVNEREIYWIAFYASPLLTNATIGGDGTLGFAHTDETKARIGAASARRLSAPEAKAKAVALIHTSEARVKAAASHDYVATAKKLSFRAHERAEKRLLESGVQLPQDRVK